MIWLFAVQQKHPIFVNLPIKHTAILCQHSPLLQFLWFYQVHHQFFQVVKVCISVEESFPRNYISAYLIFFPQVLYIMNSGLNRNGLKKY